MSETKYAVPMYESEKGWGSKIDGYAGPFDSLQAAEKFRADYNQKYNSEAKAPDYYIVALDPVVYNNHNCEYRTTVEAE